METNVMQKKSLLLVLLLCLVLALSGCKLVQKDQEVANSLVVLSYNGTDVTRGEVDNVAYNYLINQYYMASMYGQSYDISNPSNIKEMQMQAVE